MIVVMLVSNSALLFPIKRTMLILLLPPQLGAQWLRFNQHVQQQPIHTISCIQKTVAPPLQLFPRG